MSGRIRHFEPPLRPVPSNSRYTEFETADGRRTFIHQEVLFDLAELERDEHPNESAGLLFGRTFTDGANQCTLVRHLIRPEPGEVIGSVATVTITADGSNQMSQRAQECYPCADAVGWAHTHPTFNAYFSGTDRAEQAIWTAPASVGLVISGLAGADPPYEVFVGPDSAPTQRAEPPISHRRIGPPPPPARRRVAPAPDREPNGIAASEEVAPGEHLRRRPGHRPWPRPRLDSDRLRRFCLSVAIGCAIAVVIWLLVSWSTGGRSDSASAGVAPAALVRQLEHEGAGVADRVRLVLGSPEPAAAKGKAGLPDFVAAVISDAGRRVTGIIGDHGSAADGSLAGGR